jgi:hypothetical protein
MRVTSSRPWCWGRDDAGLAFSDGRDHLRRERAREHEGLRLKGGVE